MNENCHVNTIYIQISFSLEAKIFTFFHGLEHLLDALILLDALLLYALILLDALLLHALIKHLMNDASPNRPSILCD